VGLMAANYVAIVLEVGLEMIVRVALLAVITTLLAYRAVRRVMQFHSSIEEFIQVNATAIQIYLHGDSPVLGLSDPLASYLMQNYSQEAEAARSIENTSAWSIHQ
jgi:hypothetical protein